MKRFRESGASYRRKKQARAEFEKQNEGALLKFINTSISDDSHVNHETNSSYSNKNTNIQISEETVSILPDQSLHVSDIPSTEQVDNETEIMNKTATEIYKELYDVGKWPDKISESLRLWLVEQSSERFQHLDTDFTKIPAILKPQEGGTKSIERLLSKEWFYRHLNNGEKSIRKWMCYSPSKNFHFAFVVVSLETLMLKIHIFNFCSLHGFNKWGKLNPKLSNHESSPLHGQHFLKWKELELRLRSEKCINNENESVIAKEAKTWQDILQRLFEIIKFLAKQNLPLRGHREDDTRIRTFSEN